MNLNIPRSNQRNVTADWPTEGTVHTASHSQCGTGVGERIETRDPKEWGLQADSKQMGNCRLNCQQLPVWNLVTEQRAKISNQMGN